MAEYRESHKLSLMRDLIVDARAADRDGLTEYAAKSRAQIRALFRARHTVRLDMYGWPRLPEFEADRPAFVAACRDLSAFARTLTRE